MNHINPQFSCQLTTALAHGAPSVISLLNQKFMSLPGARAVTWLAASTQQSLIRRIGTSDPIDFPAGESEPIDDSAWCQRIFNEKRPVVGDTPAQMATYIPETEQLVARGFGATLCAPIIIGGDVRGTVNILGDTGILTKKFLAEVEMLLPIAALIFTFPKISELTKTTTGETPEQSNQGDGHALL